MTAQILEKLAKKANVNLSQCDSVHSFLNSRGTKIITAFYITEVLGGERSRILVGETTTMFSSLLKREEYDDDYYTNGIERIFYIK